MVDEMIKMEINEEEAWKVFLAIESDESDKVMLRLRIRILEEFPLIDEKLKYQEWQNYLWEVGAEDDNRVIQARAELEKSEEELGLPDKQFKQSDFYVALDNLMHTKRLVVEELLKE